MKKRARQAVLRVMLLREEFSWSEIFDAIEIVKRGGFKDAIGECSKRHVPRSERRDETPGVENGLTNTVASLKDRDQDRYILLSAFEKMLRTKSVLPRLDDIRRVGASMSKGFPAVKSRTEGIRRLMELFATTPFDEAQERVQDAIQDARLHGEEHGSYQRLADFLIHGAETSREEGHSE